MQKAYFFLTVGLIASLSFVSQNAKTDFIKNQDYLSANSLSRFNNFYGDSLKGFNEDSARAQLLNRNLYGTEYFIGIKLMERNFVNKRFHIGLESSDHGNTPQSVNKNSGGLNSINNLPCVNEGFETTAPGTYTTASAVTGWTVDSGVNTLQGVGCTGSLSTWVSGSPEFSIASTPIAGITYTGGTFSIDNVTIPNSPLGGTHVARLQNSTPGNLVTRLRSSFAVGAANSMFRYAWAGSWDGSGHACCDQPSFNIHVYDCTGALIPCLSQSLTPFGASCSTGLYGYTVSAGTSWCNWQTRYIDLSSFIGSCVTIEVINSDCNAGNHHGSVYFDAHCGYNFNNQGEFYIDPISLCSNSGQAQIIAPLGYSSYQWYAPGNISVPNSNSAILTITNAVAGNVYTVQMITAAGCTLSMTDTLKYSTVSIAGVLTNSTCGLGSIGSATVFANGSGNGYNYAWYSQTSLLSIGTGSVINNLAAGIYSVTVSSPGSATCGSAVATVTIGSSPVNLSTVYKPFCNGEAYLSAPSTGANYQWYNNLSAIAGTLGGSASAYTASPAANGNLYHLAYISSPGCKDSINFILNSVTPGNLVVSYNQLTCQGANNGLAVLSITPSANSVQSTNSFSVFSTGSSSYAVSNAIASSISTFTAGNLFTGNTYSVIAFDGLCKYTSSFSVNTLSYNFTLTPATPTVCNGNSIIAGAVFNGTPSQGQYSYSWTPTTFLQGNNGSVQLATITPTTAPGTIATIVYTVLVTPSILNCPLSHTMAITITNLPTPTLVPIPNLCSTDQSYTITVNPSGGVFSNNAAGFVNGVISPSQAGLGIHIFYYSLMSGTCVSSITGSFVVYASPTVAIEADTVICSGDTLTLTASGAYSYTWNTNNIGEELVIIPAASGVYSVSGTNISNGCVNTQSIAIIVNPLPLLSVSGNTVICPGQTTTVTALGTGAYYSWSTSSSSPYIIVSPLVTSGYTVISHSNNNCTASQAVTVNVAECTNIHELKVNNELLKIYPNPLHETLFIELASEARLSLYDEAGVLLFDNFLKSGKHPIGFSDKSDGIYLLKVNLANEIKIIKLIKIH